RSILARMVRSWLLVPGMGIGLVLWGVVRGGATKDWIILMTKFLIAAATVMGLTLLMAQAMGQAPQGVAHDLRDRLARAEQKITELSNAAAVHAEQIKKLVDLLDSKKQNGEVKLPLADLAAATDKTDAEKTAAPVLVHNSSPK